MLGLFYFRGGNARPAAVVKVFLYPAGYKIVFMIVGVSVYAGLVLSKQSGVFLIKVFLESKKGALVLWGFCGKGAWLNKEPGESRLLAAGLWPGSKPTHPTRRDPQGSTYHETDRGLRLKIVV